MGEPSKYSKDIYDAVHKTITLPALITEFVDTPEFQRLRRIKQLGAASFVYPTATHTRFEHSIGCGHLARKLATSLLPEQQKTRFLDLIQLAGCLHDIGHGPFSHVYEHIYPEYNHEDESCKQIQEMNSRLKVLSDEEVAFIQRVIKGSTLDDAGSLHGVLLEPWIFQIVANKHSHFDVDKCDYIIRDSMMLGFSPAGCSHAIDIERIFKHTKVIDGYLAFNQKIFDDLLNIFRLRYQLHRKVYSHPVVITIETMIKHSILKSKEALARARVVKGGRTPEEAARRYDDSILSMIEFLELPGSELIQRIHNRELYTYQLTLVNDQRQLEKREGTRTTVINRRIGYTGCANKKEGPIADIPFFSISPHQKGNTPMGVVKPLSPACMPSQYYEDINLIIYHPTFP